jgi:hypothetical protein
MKSVKHFAGPSLVMRRPSCGISMPAAFAATRIAIFLAFVCVPLYGQPPITFTQFGSNASDAAWSVSATVRAVYVGGNTGGALPGQTNAGNVDGFLRAYDRNGVELWTRQFGTSGTDLVSATTAVDGSIYIAGSTDGAFPGHTNAGSSDAFIRKYDAQGNELWTRQFGTFAPDGINGAVATIFGVYVVGTTSGTLPGQTGTGADTFVRKYDVHGNELWTHQFAASGGAVYGLGIDAIPGDGVYIAGTTYGDLVGGPPSNDGDAFLRKYDTAGNELWTRQFGTASIDSGISVAATLGGVYVAGGTYGVFPGETLGGTEDAFVRKYDAQGNELWTRQFGSPDQESVFCVTAVAGGVYITGLTYGTLPGQSSAAGGDAFVAKYNSHGVEQWVAQFGTSDLEVATSASAILGGVYIVGHTGGTLPGQINAGGSDAFLAFMSAR